MRVLILQLPSPADPRGAGNAASELAADLRESGNTITFAANALTGLRAGDTDVVLCVDPRLRTELCGWLVSLRHRRPLMIAWREADAVDAEGRMKRVLQGLVDRACAGVTVPSRRMKERLVHRGVAARKIEIIPKCIALEERCEEEENHFRIAYGLHGKFVVMIECDLTMQAPVDVLLVTASALRAHSRIQLIIAGEGPAKSHWVKIARERKLENIRFMPRHPAAIMPEIFGGIDLALVFDDGPANPPANPVEQACAIMAQGRPILAIAGEGSELADLVQAAGAGTSLSAADPQRLANTIRRMAESPDRLREQGDAGRAFLEKHHSRSVILSRLNGALRAAFAGINFSGSGWGAQQSQRW